MVFVKVCGIQTWEEAVAALDRGATALGFLVGLTHRAEDEIGEAEARAIVRRLPAGATRRSSIEKSADRVSKRTRPARSSCPSISAASFSAFRSTRRILSPASPVAPRFAAHRSPSRPPPWSIE